MNPSTFNHRFSFLSTSIFFITLSFAVTGFGCGKKEEVAPAKHVSVITAQVEQKDMPVYQEFVGQTIGSKDVEIRARVEGYLETVNFKEGSFVKKGDLLYQIDPKPFQAALDQAKGKLGEAQARFEKSQNDVKRFKPLVEQNAISQQELDNAMSSFNAAKSMVESAQAVTDQAELNLSYTKIESPVDGLIDASKVMPGNLVGRGENTLMTTISQIDPIDVKVSLTESQYLYFTKLKAAREASGEVKPKFPIQLILADGSVHPEDGVLNFLERAVDPTTGTLAVRVSFPNPQKILRPGQYAKIRAVGEVKKGAMLVPQRAVQELQGMFRVGVVDAENKVSIRTVKTGQRFDNLWQIEEGLSAGEKIIVEGFQKVRDGSLVAPEPSSAEAAASTEPAKV